MKELHAHQVSIEENEGALVLALGQGGGRYAILSRATSYDEQDVSLGHDALHLEIDDPSHSVYGIVGSVEANGNALQITFDAAAIGLGPDHSPLKIIGNAVAQKMPEIKAAACRLMSKRIGLEDV